MSFVAWTPFIIVFLAVWKFNSIYHGRIFVVTKRKYKWFTAYSFRYSIQSVDGISKKQKKFVQVFVNTRLNRWSVTLDQCLYFDQSGKEVSVQDSLFQKQSRAMLFWPIPIREQSRQPSRHSVVAARLYADGNYRVRMLSDFEKTS